MTTPKKPTPAQLEALQFVKTNGPSGLPQDYNRRSHGVNVRRDVWDRCHSAGWLTSADRVWHKSQLTEEGERVLKTRGDD